MIDFHNHVIPGVDDGAKSFDTAMSMVKKAYNDGTRTIISTVHFQHPTIPFVDLEYYHILSLAKKIEEKAIRENCPIKIIPSAEVYYSSDLKKLLNNELVIINDQFMLIEFNPQLLPKDLASNFFSLQVSGITPIVAHPERYRNIQINIDIAKKWKEKDYLLQVNAGSILGNYGPKVKKTALRLVENGLCHFVGSDAHDQNRRPFCLKESYKIIEKITNKEYVDLLKNNSESLIKSKEILNFQPKKVGSNFFGRISDLFK